MATNNLNAGSSGDYTGQFRQHGQLVLVETATDNIVEFILRDTFQLQEGLRSLGFEYDGPQMTGRIRLGDERPSSLTFQVQMTKAGLDGDDSIFAVLNAGEDTTQKKGFATTFDVELKLWDEDPSGMSPTGVERLIENCYVQDMRFVAAGESGQGDVYEITIAAADPLGDDWQVATVAS